MKLWRTLVLCVLAPVVLWGQTSSGTTGVAIWTPERSVLAIDSRITLTVSGLMRQGPDECKLRTAGKFVVAIAGLNNHAETNFDAWRLAIDSVLPARSVSEAARLVETRMQLEVESALRNLQSNSRNFRDAHVVVVIAGWDAAGPSMAARDFVPDGNGNVRVQRWNSSPETGAMYAFGERDAIQELPRNTIRDWIGVDLAKSAKRLVERQIERSPRTVGPPVSVIEITANGLNWVEPGLCK